MDTTAAFAEHDSQRLRPVARWVLQQDDSGGSQLVMVWSVPDPDASLGDLTAARTTP